MKVPGTWENILSQSVQSGIDVLIFGIELQAIMVMLPGSLALENVF